MCVTNTTGRRPPAITLAPEMVANTSSMLSQRLFSNVFAAQQQQDNSQYVETQTSHPCDMYATQQPQQQMPSLMGATMSTRVEKPRPKRRRKPQKPGKTAKMNDRHFVIHNYHDHSHDADENDTEDEVHRRRGGVSIAFPLKLHAVLDQVEADGLGHIVSWQPHGRCFVVHKPKEFVDHVMPKYFRQTKLTSFQRQLNLYGFSRLTRGNDAGGYYHELFLRGMPHLCKKMTRTKVKGTRFKAASSPESEPDFYKMPPVTVTPQHSDEEYASYPQVVERPVEVAPYAAAAPQAFAPQQQQTASFDPLPYASLQSAAAMPEARPMYEPVQAAIPYATMPEAVAPERSYADQVLDEAVDELFLQEALMDNNDSSNNAWDNISNFGDDASLQDEQLGMLLEQLLDE